MALSLTRHVVLRKMLRSSPVDVGRSASNTRRALAVRAFKEEHKQKEHKPQAQEQEQAQSPAPTAAASTTPESVSPVAPPPPPLPLEVLPFRRMTDAMSQMQREMDALMDSFGLDDPFFGGFGAPRRSSRRVGGPLSSFSLLDSLMMPGLPANSSSSTTATATPSSLARAVGPLSRMVPVEVAEDDQSVIITAEVPGFAKEHIKVEVDPARKMLTISGEKTTVAKGQTEAGGPKEGEPSALAHSSMTFMRSFSLPPEVDVDKEIKATAEHGVLKVVLPKVPRQEPAANVRQIPVA